MAHKRWWLLSVTPKWKQSYINALIVDKLQ